MQARKGARSSGGRECAAPRNEQREKKAAARGRRREFKKSNFNLFSSRFRHATTTTMLYVYVYALAIAAGLARSARTLPTCNTSVWSGPCTWPNTPPPDCPFPQSPLLTGVSFSGRFGSYPSTAADTWYPSADAAGSLYTSFADGRVCTTPPAPPPLPPGLGALQWWWSEAQQDNALTTDALPPEGATYERVGVAGYALAAPPAGGGGCALALYRAAAGSREYWTTCGSAEAAAAEAAGYGLVAPLGLYLPAAPPPPPPPPQPALPPSSATDLPPGWASGWHAAAQYYSASRGDHFLSPEPSAPAGYARAAQPWQGSLLLQLGGGGAACVVASGVSAAQGAAVLSGADPFNLTVTAVLAVPHPPVNVTFPGQHGVYPSTSFVYNGSWVIGYYLLADPSGAGCGNWCHLGPLLAFAVGSTAAAPAPAPPAWSYDGAPCWGGSGAPQGVFEPIDVTRPIRMGVPRFVDFGPDAQHSPDGRAYLVGKGCARNDGVRCSFMTGDSAYLARTTLPLAGLGGNLSALNAASAWEFYAGGEGSPVWAPTLAGSAPLFTWPTGIGGLAVTYNAVLARYIAVVNLPGDRVRPTDCSFDTFVLESGSVTGPYSLVSYMEGLGPQMYFQQLSAKFWSADGSTGVLFSSGNWDGKCIKQGSNPPGERYGLVTTEVSFVLAAQ